MTRKLIAFAALTLGLLGTASAMRIVGQPEAAYELRLQDVQALPQSTAGYFTFKTCPDCDTGSLPVNASTQYFIGRQGVTLTQFVQAADGYRQTDGTTGKTAVYLFYDVAAKRATRAVLNHFGS